MKRNLILTDGGMGDLLCQLVAVDYLVKQHREIKFQVWLPDYLRTFAMHVLQYQQVFPFSKANKLFDKTLPGRTTQWFQHGHTPMRTHPIDYGFHMLADRHIYDLSQKEYLQIRPWEINLKKFNLPKDYICIQTVFAEPVKSLNADELESLTDNAMRKGLRPVYLGKEDSKTGFQDKAVKGQKIQFDMSRGIDLVNKTDLLQSAAIIAGSKHYVGMDGGLTHLAGFTNATIVAGYTLVSPSHAAPYRYYTNDKRIFCIEPDASVSNLYFQTNNHFYEGDYRTFPIWEAVRDNVGQKLVEYYKLLPL